MLGWIIAIISGALMSFQGVFNTAVTEKTSIWMSAAFVQITAFFVCVFCWLVTGREGNFGGFLQVQPRICLLGGVIGAFITITVIKSMEALDPARAVMFIVISQLIVAYAIELLGWFGVDKQEWSWRKAIGMAVAIAGVVIFKWK